jgi:nucleoside-diphosphate-sugar epimerase
VAELCDIFLIDSEILLLQQLKISVHPYLWLIGLLGTGRGPGSQRSRQVYELSKVTLQRKKAPIIGAGQSYWNNVNVHDLSDLFRLLVDAAVSGKQKDADGVWGESAYYLAENGEHRWGEVAKQIADCAADLGYIPEAAIEKISNAEDAKLLAGFESLSWGMNSRGRARRARKLLGWNPSRPSLEDEIPNIVKREWQLLRK